MTDRKRSGCIYEETYDKGRFPAGMPGERHHRRKRYTRFVAEITINGIRYRHRSTDRAKLERWLEDARQGRIT